MEQLSDNPRLGEYESFRATLSDMSDEAIEAMIDELREDRDRLSNDPDSSLERGRIITKIGVLYNELNSYERRFPDSISTEFAEDE
ncbi:MAG TPA: hypothetical protein VLE51_03495 [Candidatus Saccharimonadales bacterium]|nr:hypothetical protein [Candidatus Saccharimonadales bacterium]